MKNLPTLLAAGLLVLIMAFYMCTFQVRFTEVAIKKTFGEPSAETCTEPKLYLKWPWPIQSVVKFDKRIQLLDDRTEETITADSKNIIIRTSTLWKITDPYLFHLSFPRQEDGEKQLRSAIRAQKKAVIGRYNFSNLVSTVPGERKLRQIENDIMKPVHAKWKERHGVSIEYLGITKLTLPESVTQAIFDSMKKHEQNKADNYLAEGEAQGQQILAAARAAKQRIMAVAERKADEIRNEGNRVVSQLYALFEEEPELRIFLDKLNAIEEAFSNDTTFIFDTSMTPIDLFDEGPTASSDAGDLDLIRIGQSMGNNESASAIDDRRNKPRG